MTRHVEPDELERYALKRLPAERLDAIEDHLLICAECRFSLEKVEDLIASMRGALQKEDGSTPIDRKRVPKKR